MFGSEQESIRILLIEEEVLVREALKALLESWGLNVGEVANADEAAGHIRHLKPDIVLLSLSGNEQLDRKIVRDVVSACGDAPLLVLLASDDEDFRLQVIRLGPRSVVLKTKPVVELLKAIQEIHLATPSEQTLMQVSTQVLSCSEKKRLLAAHNKAFNIYMRVAAELAEAVGITAHAEFEFLSNKVQASRQFLAETREQLTEHTAKHGC
jgi:DNA-binding NarL/FixJ family response regulator